MAYSDALKQEVMIRLAVNKYDYDLTEEQTGVTARTIRTWEKNYLKNSVPELLERAIERMLMNIPSNWKGNDWAIALGILMDKWLLVQGKATSRNENILGFLEEIPEDDRDRIIREAEQILSAAAGGSVDISDHQR